MKKFIYTVAITVSLIIAGLLMLVFTYKAWATYPTEYLGGKPVYFYEDDEFIGGLTTSGSIGKQGWVTWHNTSQTITVSLGQQTNQPGSIHVTHGTTATTALLCVKDCTATTGIFRFEDDFDTTVIMALPTYGRPSFIGYYLWLGSTLNHPAIYITNNNNATDTWYAACTGCSTTNTGVAITSNTWYKFRIKKIGTSVEFYIDDVLKATLTTTATGAFQPTFQLNWTTTQRYMEIDYWNFIIPSSGR